MTNPKQALGRLLMRLALHLAPTATAARQAYGVRVTAKTAEVLEYPSADYWVVEVNDWLRVFSQHGRPIAEFRPETWAIVETASYAETE